MNETPFTNKTIYTCKRPSMWRYDTLMFEGDTQIAELKFDTWSMMKANLKTLNGEWSLELGGALVNEYSVFEVASGEEIALLEGNMSMEYKLKLRNESLTQLTFTNKWRGWHIDYIWVDTEGNALITFLVKATWTGTQITIEVNLDRSEGLDTVFLSGLALYILIHHQMAGAASVM